jgi:hypothetical protein
MSLRWIILIVALAGLSSAASAMVVRSLDPIRVDLGISPFPALEFGVLTIAIFCALSTAVLLTSLIVRRARRLHELLRKPSAGRSLGPR